MLQHFRSKTADRSGIVIYPPRDNLHNKLLLPAQQQYVFAVINYSKVCIYPLLCTLKGLCIWISRFLSATLKYGHDNSSNVMGSLLYMIEIIFLFFMKNISKSSERFRSFLSAKPFYIGFRKVRRNPRTFIIFVS